MCLSEPTAIRWCTSVGAICDQILRMTLSCATEVLIVGGGPVGLSLAGDLGGRGVRTLLIEQSDGGIVQPKMDMVGVRTMEFCRRWGLLEAVRNAPYPLDYRQDCVWGTTLTGYEFGREPFASRGDEKPAMRIELGVAPSATRLGCEASGRSKTPHQLDNERNRHAEMRGSRMT